MCSPKDTINADEFELRCSPSPPLPASPTYLDCDDISITEEGVKKLLLKLDHNKAHGPDEITFRLQKTVAEEITPSLTLLFRTSQKTGILP